MLRTNIKPSKTPKTLKQAHKWEGCTLTLPLPYRGWPKGLARVAFLCFGYVFVYKNQEKWVWPKGLAWRGAVRFLYISVYFNDFCMIFMGFVAHKIHENFKKSRISQWFLWKIIDFFIDFFEKSMIFKNFSWISWATKPMKIVQKSLTYTKVY